MDVWLTKCRKTAKCYHCEKPIENNDYMVVCKYWRKRDGNAVNWPFKMRFHANCWIERGIQHIENNPRVETRGRKRQPMTDETRVNRLKIMRRRAAVVQRIKLERVKVAESQNVDRIIHLGAMLAELRSEIEVYGGAPKDW